MTINTSSRPNRTSPRPRPGPASASSLATPRFPPLAQPGEINMIDLVETTNNPGSLDIQDPGSRIDVFFADTLAPAPSQPAKAAAAELVVLEDSDVVVPDSPELNRGNQDLTKMDLDGADILREGSALGDVLAGDGGGRVEFGTDDGLSPPPLKRKPSRKLLRIIPFAVRSGPSSPTGQPLTPVPSKNLLSAIPTILKPGSGSSSTLTSLDGLLNAPPSPSRAPSAGSLPAPLASSQTGSPSRRLLRPHKFTLEVPVPPAAIKRLSASPRARPTPASAGSATTRARFPVKKKVSTVQKETDQSGSDEATDSSTRASPRKTRAKRKRVKDEFSDTSEDNEGAPVASGSGSNLEDTSAGTNPSSSESEDDDLLKAALERAKVRRAQGQGRAVAVAADVKAEDEPVSPDGLRRSGRTDELEARRKAKQHEQTDRINKEQRAREFEREQAKGRIALSRMVREHKEREKNKDQLEKGRSLMMVSSNLSACFCWTQKSADDIRFPGLKEL